MGEAAKVENQRTATELWSVDAEVSADLASRHPSAGYPLNGGWTPLRRLGGTEILP